MFFPVKNKLPVAPLLSPLLCELTPGQSVMLSGEGGLSLPLPRVESILSGICSQLWLHQILETAQRMVQELLSLSGFGVLIV